MIMKTSLVAIALACFSAMTAEAHVGLRRPCGRYTSAAGCPAPPPGQSIDYDINSPVGTHDSINAPLCKHTVPYATRTTYKAGETINTQYSVGATHGGGHCQWALSYDDGKTWVVIETRIRSCLKDAGQDYSVPITIPADAPSGKATFMWLWNNAIGNRELYSNCADIEIQGRAGGQIKGVAPLIANYGPNSKYIGEFPGSQDDGSRYFAERPPVTIGAGGGSGGNPPPPPPSKPPTQPTLPPTKPTVPPTKPTANPGPTPSCNAAMAVTKTVTVTKTVYATHRPRRH
ncbi:hypothetical protein BGZ75_001833 [Mortierella antarctica]|nr:hypothetical protein BGZ67_004506 [Mortierella alpina]KAF9986409.1 hypothetical protein BGZ75_001833 [Mortierella antarctica]